MTAKTTIKLCSVAERLWRMMVLVACAVVELVENVEIFGVVVSQHPSIPDDHGYRDRYLSLLIRI